MTRIAKNCLPVLAAAVISAASLLNGCATAALMVGGGTAGYLMSAKDTIEGYSDRPYASVWEAGQEVLTKEGTIKNVDRESGSIKAEINGSNVQLMLNQVSPETVRIHVKARKMMHMVPDVHLARDLYAQIMDKL